MAVSPTPIPSRSVQRAQGLEQVRTSAARMARYEKFLSERERSELRGLSAMLRGARIIHINATPLGGGVAEMLSSSVPLSRDIGLDAAWYTLPPDARFFDVTKQIHNWLQGAPGELGSTEQRTYSEYLERLAAEMAGLRADVWVIHDPQPLALRSLVPLEGVAVWRCHVDCSTPNECVRDYLQPWVRAYDQAVFSMPAYVLPGLSERQTRIASPAIDPLAPKNAPLRRGEIGQTLTRLGIDPGRPLAVQVSRFDRWKNPWQAVDAYRLARAEVPGLQLALVGVFAAKDDPEGPEIYRDVLAHVGEDPNVHLLTDPATVGAREVNALQAGATVVLQRSTREGFGLTVTESMWKQRAVIATPVGGIPSQVTHGTNGYLATSTEDCADLIVRVVRDPSEARRVGRAARESVRERFLLPRLLLDEVRSYAELLSGHAPAELAA